jgi:hypothetical protein
VGAAISTGGENPTALGRYYERNIKGKGWIMPVSLDKSGISPTCSNFEQVGKP